MSDTVIRVENLSKKYLISELQTWHQTIRGAITAVVTNSLYRIRNFRSKNSNKETTIWALKDVFFEVKNGDVVGIIGCNGAGKSTLLKILSRITEPTKGRIEIHGRIGSLLEVGTGFHQELTGRENIFLNGAILGMKKSEIKRKFDEIVEFAGIGKFIDTPVKRYSSGMYVRLAFAVAAHLDPEILIIDEVLAVGDAAFQKKCLSKMGDEAKKGRTILFVSHNMAMISQLCNKGILLSQGRTICMGTMDSVINKYLQTLSPLQSYSTPYIARNDFLDVTFKGFDLLNDKGEVVPAMQVGSPITFRLYLETTTYDRDLVVSIAVNTLQDTRICVFHTIISGFTYKLRSPGTNIHCRLPKVPFLPGLYRLSIKVAVDGSVAFYSPHAMEVIVEAGNFFGTGRIPDSRWGGTCLIEHSWDADYSPFRER